MKTPEVEMINEILTVKEAAAYLRLSEMTVLRLANQGRIRGAKIGRQWRFEKDAILKLVREAVRS